MPISIKKIVCILLMVLLFSPSCSASNMLGNPVHMDGAAISIVNSLYPSSQSVFQSLPQDRSGLFHILARLLNHRHSGFKVSVLDGSLILGQQGTAGRIVMNGATSGTATINVPAVAGTTTFTLPGVNGTPGQALIWPDEGSTLTWATFGLGEGTSLVDGAVTTSAPSYTTGSDEPLSLNTSGGLRVDGSGVTQPVSIASMPSTPVTGTFFQATQPVSLAGSVAVTGLFYQATQPVSIATMPTTPVTGTFYQATQPVSIAATVTVDEVNLDLAQASTTSGQFGNLVLGAATTSAPTDSTGMSYPLSLNTSGGLRVDGSGVTQPVSGTITANAGTGTFGVSGTVTANAGTNLNTSLLALETGGNLGTIAGAVTSSVMQENIKQINGVTPLVGNGVTGTGSPRVTIASDNTPFSVNAIESGTWNINNVSGTISLPTGAATSAKQPALGTAGTASSDVITVQGISSMTALKVDGSGVTQPVSGTVTANAGSGTFATNDASNVAQGSTTSGQTGPLVQTATTTSAPTYSTAKTNPLSTTTAGALRTDSSATTQPVSGTVTANAGTGTMTVDEVNLDLAQASTTAGQLGNLALGAASTSAPTDTNGKTYPLSLTTSGFLRVDPSGVTSPVSIASMPTTPVTGTFWQTTQPVSGTFWQTTQPVSIASLPTGVVTEANLDVAQGATTSGQQGPLIQAAASTSAPTDTNGRSYPLSLNTSGGLRVDPSGVTSPVSASSLPLPSNAAQETGGNLASIATNTSNTATNTSTAATNTGNIATNTSNTATNTSTIAGAVSASKMNVTGTISQVAATIPSSTTLQSAATANGNGSNMTVTGYATALLHITASVGMSGGTTINFEASTDNSTWVSILGTQVGSTGAATTTTAIVGDFYFNIAGYNYLRARISAYSAGTITVVGYETTMASLPQIGILGIANGGTNNGSLGVLANGIIVGNGTGLSEIAGLPGQTFRVNNAGTGVEAFTLNSVYNVYPLLAYSPPPYTMTVGSQSTFTSAQNDVFNFGRICNGPDGRLWVTYPSANKIAAWTKAGVETVYATTGSSTPTGICAGPDGRIWVCYAGTNKLAAFTVSGTETVYTASKGADSVCVGADQRLWVANSLGNNCISAFSTTGTETDYNIGPYGNTVFYYSGTTSNIITPGPDGRLWLYDTNDSVIGGTGGRGTGNYIIAVTISGGVANGTYYNTNYGTKGICVGPDGRMWLLLIDSGGVHRMAQYLTDGSVENDYVINNSAISIFPGSDLRMWYADGSSHLGALTLAGAVETDYTLTGSGAASICVGSDGNMWAKGQLGSNATVANLVLEYTLPQLLLTSPLVATSGGSGSATAPTNGQVMVGSTASGNYGPATIGTGTGISTTTGANTLTINNTGVTSNVAGSGISVSGATGAVTIGNTGVTSAIAGTGVGVSGATGAVTFSNTGVTSNVAGSGISVSGATGAVTIGNTGVTSNVAGNGISISGATGTSTIATTGVPGANGQGGTAQNTGGCPSSGFICGPCFTNGNLTISGATTCADCQINATGNITISGAITCSNFITGGQGNTTAVNNATNGNGGGLGGGMGAVELSTSIQVGGGGGGHAGFGGHSGSATLNDWAVGGGAYPPSTILDGSGGGAGQDDGTASGTSGGNGGGTCQINAGGSITISANVTAPGGAGIGTTTASQDCGGGGSGGGLEFNAGGAISVGAGSVSITASGGAGGSNTSASTKGGAGGGGSIGWIRMIGSSVDVITNTPTVLSTVGAAGTGNITQVAAGGALPTIGSMQVTIASSSPTNGDIVKITVTNANVSGSPLAISYTLGASPSNTTIATGLAAAINASAAMAADGITATASGAIITIISWDPTVTSTYAFAKTSGTGTYTSTTLLNSGTSVGGLILMQPVNGGARMWAR